MLIFRLKILRWLQDEAPNSFRPHSLRPSVLRPSALRNNEQGFSLLELLVVLTIMALMLSMVSIRMVDNIEGSRFIRTAEAAVADVLIIRVEAMTNAKPRSLITNSAPVDKYKDRQQTQLRRLDVPEGWQVEGDAIEISASGVCSGGILALTNPKGRKIVFRLEAPRCKPERLNING